VEDTRVGRRYAKALFTTALKYDLVKSVEDDLHAIVGLLRTDPGFRNFLMAPYRGREEKVALLDRVFSDRVTALTMQVLRVMLEKRREAELEVIEAEYIRLRRENQRIVYATFTSAEVLDENQKTALVQKLATGLGKTIEGEFQVDPHLMGGVRVTYENYVLDGTVRGALSRLREKLRYDLLKQQG